MVSLVVLREQDSGRISSERISYEKKYFVKEDYY